MDTGICHISSVIQSYLEELDYRYQNQGKPLGISTGIKALDEKICGLRGGEVILLSGRPAMGKTSFAINLSYKIAKSFLEEKNPNSNKCVLYFSLELPKLLWISRSIAAKLPTSQSRRLTRFEYGSTSYDEFEKIAKIGKEFEKMPIYICDKSFSIEQIEKKINEICKHNIGFIVVDYLELLWSQNKTHNLGYCMRYLKELAKNLDVPILVLSQLNRSVEKRKDRHPLMCDLRHGSTAPLEQIADVVMFLYRESYYLWDEEPKIADKETGEHFQKRMKEWEKECREKTNECEFIIGKARYGATGRIKCFCDLSNGIFDNLEHSDNDIPF